MLAFRFSIADHRFRARPSLRAGAPIHNRKSLDVLHQFPNLLQGSLDLDNVTRDIHVAGLGADRIGLAEHFLSQELQFAACALRLADDFLKLVQMTGQADHLLGDVAALGEDRDLLDKIVTVDLHVQFGEQAAHALDQPVAKGGDHLRRAGADGVELSADEVAELEQLLRHGTALVLAHRLQALQRLVKDRLQDRPVFLEVQRGVARLGDHAGQGERLAEQDVGAIAQAQLLGQAAELMDVTAQGGGVDAEVLWREAPLAAQVDLDGAAAHAAAYHLLELRFEKVIRFGGAERHLEVAVVQRAQLKGDADLVALVMRLSVPGHAQQHTNPPRVSGEWWVVSGLGAGFRSGRGILSGAGPPTHHSPLTLSVSGALHQDHDQQYPDPGDDDREAGEGVPGAAAEGAGAADAAEGSRQPAALAALNQHHQDEEQAHHQQQDVQQADEEAGQLRKERGQCEHGTSFQWSFSNPAVSGPGGWLEKDIIDDRRTVERRLPSAAVSIGRRAEGACPHSAPSKGTHLPVSLAPAC